MAVYVPPSRRRRLTIVVAVAAFAVGGAIGYPIGRSSAPSTQDKIADAKASARDFVTSLRVLPLEYGQAYRGSSETRLIVATVNGVVGRLDSTLGDAPWLAPTARAGLKAVVSTVPERARARVPPAQFDRAVEAAARAVESTYGLTNTPAA